MSKNSITQKLFRIKSFVSQLVVKRMQKIVLEFIPEGNIIDIGGGGEGIIAQIGKERVTAIDKYQREIDEAKHKSPETTWVLADAKDLDYSNDYFDNATSFFSIMYMSNVDKIDVFKEVYRVLKPHGEFWIWDSNISKEKGVFFIKIKAVLPDKKVVRTGYGVSSKKQTINSTKETLENCGFKVEVVENQKNWFFLKAKK
ncbi:MAG: methyltransferase domain-containing protein [Candidatus Heimdallarchaeota archaeon]|nr:methyltransferase domain-containing protein [Candidatus Heimdallarchaeota archaeon]MCK5143393.1 methyltransferase domain-containing protein [Candidatus Heimdallarchaeota archaeon]